MGALNWADDFVSAIMGTIMAVVFISLFGNWLSTRWSDAAFSKKWRNYRNVVASNLEKEMHELEFKLACFGRELEEIAKKDQNEITVFDFNMFNLAYADIVSRIRNIEKFFGSYHFCLRAVDIEIAQEFVSDVESAVGTWLKDQRLTLQNFEAMLSSHLQGTFALNKEIGRGTPWEGTRHQFMLACATTLKNTLEEIDHLKWRIKLVGLLKSLRG